MLKLALTHRSYLSVTGQGPRESNERLEFLGDSVLGLVTSEYLYRRHPDDHEGQLTKTKSLLVSKAILSRRALRMGLGRFVLMSHSEVESGGRQRLSILADAFESVLGAVYLDQGFEAARQFIHTHLLEDSDSIVSDKRHTNYKSHLQEYVQSTYRTHPVYRIRSEYGPDHSKHFMVEVMVSRRTLGEGRGHNKKEAEQAAARDALERVEKVRRGEHDEAGDTAARDTSATALASEAGGGEDSGDGRRRRRSRRGGRGRSGSDSDTELVAESSRGAQSTPRSWASDEDESVEDMDKMASAAEPGLAGGDAATRRPDGDDVSEPIDDDEYEEVEVDDLDESEDDDSDDDDSEDDFEDEADDGDEPDDDDEDGEEEDEARGPTLTPSSLPVSAPIARESAGGPTQPAAAARVPVSEVAYGRSRRRAPLRTPTAIVPGVPAPAPVPLEQVEELQSHEELHVDPFGLEAQAHLEPVVEVIPPPDEGEDVDSRIEEMERAMANFGQRRGPDPAPKRTPYGRKGKRR